MKNSTVKKQESWSLSSNLKIIFQKMIWLSLKSSNFKLHYYESKANLVKLFYCIKIKNLQICHLDNTSFCPNPVTRFVKWTPELTQGFSVTSSYAWSPFQCSARLGNFILAGTTDALNHFENWMHPKWVIIANLKNNLLLGTSYSGDNSAWLPLYSEIKVNLDTVEAGG